MNEYISWSYCYLIKMMEFLYCNTNLITVKCMYTVSGMNRVNWSWVMQLSDHHHAIIVVQINFVKNICKTLRLLINASSIWLDTRPARHATQSWVLRLLPAGQTSVQLSHISTIISTKTVKQILTKCSTFLSPVKLLAVYYMLQLFMRNKSRIV